MSGTLYRFIEGDNESYDEDILSKLSEIEEFEYDEDILSNLDAIEQGGDPSKRSPWDFRNIVSAVKKTGQMFDLVPEDEPTEQQSEILPESSVSDFTGRAIPATYEGFKRYSGNASKADYLMGVGVERARKKGIDRYIDRLAERSFERGDPEAENYKKGLMSEISQAWERGENALPIYTRELNRLGDTRVDVSAYKKRFDKPRDLKAYKAKTTKKVAGIQKDIDGFYKKHPEYELPEDYYNLSDEDREKKYPGYYWGDAVFNNVVNSVATIGTYFASTAVSGGDPAFGAMMTGMVMYPQFASEIGDELEAMEKEEGIVIPDEFKADIAIIGAIPSAVVESASEVIGFGSGFVMKRGIKKAKKELLKKTVLSQIRKNALVRGGEWIAKQSGAGAFEEGTQKVISNVAAQIAGSERPLMQGVKQAAKVGAVIEPVMGGPAKILQKSVEAIRQETPSLDEKILANLDKIEKGQPVEEAPASFSPEQIATIAKDLTENKITTADLEAYREELKETQPVKAEQMDSILGKPLPKGKVAPEDQARAKSFDEMGKRSWDDFVPGQMKIAPETEETKNVQKVSDALKMGKVVFYDAPATQLNDVNGFYNYKSGEIYVNKNTEKPLLYVAGHESLHRLSKQAPDLYKKLVTTLKGKTFKYEEYATALNLKRGLAGLGELGNIDMSEEFVADFAAKAIATPEFWNKLNAANPTTTRKLAEILIELIGQIRKTFGTKGREFFTDIDAVGELAKAYAKFAKRDRRQEQLSTKTIKERRISQRRVDEIQRKKIEDMTEEEKTIALKHHELTGLWGKRAYNESEKKAIQVSLDVDALKWVNDTFGHTEAGDEMLKLVGKALSQTDIDAYHISGDEFYIQSNDMKKVDAAIEKAYEYLDKNPLILEYPDGTKTTYKAGFSYGKGIDTDSRKALKKAELELQEHKAERKLSKRGEKPSAGLEERTEGDAVEGRGRDTDKVTPPDNDQLIKLALDENIKYTKKVKVGKRTVSASKNAGEALSEVTEKRDIMKRIIDCV